MAFTFPFLEGVYVNYFLITLIFMFEKLVDTRICLVYVENQEKRNDKMFLVKALKWMFQVVFIAIVMWLVIGTLILLGIFLWDIFINVPKEAIDTGRMFIK